MEDIAASRIIRSKRSNDFTVLNNDIFRNTKGRTLKSIGLLCFLLHLPDDWSVNKKHLGSLFKDKRFSIDGAIDELVEAGYLKVCQRRTAGKFDGVDYYVYDTPIKPDAENQQTVAPKAGFPQPGKPQAGNQHLLNTNKDKELSSFNSNELKGAFEIEETLFTEEKKKRKIPPVPPDPPKTHQKLIDVYYEWYKDRNDGVPPKIDGAEGKAVKALQAYFHSVAKSKHGGEQLTTEELSEQVVKIFQYVLSKWDQLEPFLQKQTKIAQINSNITNIINYLKNGRKQQSAQQSKQDRAGTIAEGFAAIDKAFGG